MASFDLAIPTILAHEGGYADNPADKGGPTNFGISQTQYPYLNIKALTPALAGLIYRRDYWSYDLVTDQAVATKIFDMRVDDGLREDTLLVQRACLECGHNIVQDGVWGPQTLMAVNACVPAELLNELRAQSAWYYAKCVLEDRTQEQFLLGWMRRAVS